jgi:hypothetical protein
MSARRKPNALHTINGESRTLREWAAVAGVPYNTLLTRRQRGMRLEDALQPPKPSTYEHDGRSLSLVEWSKVTGISYVTLHGRLSKGMPFSEAIARPVRPTAWAREITYAGRTQSITAWAKELGVHPQRLKNWIDVWGVDRALGMA